MSARRTVAVMVAAGSLVAVGCSGRSEPATTTSTSARPASTTSSASTPTTVGPPTPAPSDSSATGPTLDPERPVDAGRLTAAPSELGPMFTTSDEPLPAQTTGALHDAGGQALDVDQALSSFGVFGLPRPSGANSAVMEVNVTATRLAGADGSSLSTEVLYMVASTTRIDDLLADAGEPLGSAESGPPVTVADYDGTTGDPRCARLVLDAAPPALVSVEGCEYRADPLTDVRSVGFRRMNLLVAGAPQLPSVFAGVPAVLLDAGELVGYSATFGRPAGPSGNTVQLSAQVRLTSELTELGDGWHADGPGRWWSDTATVTVDAGTATWRSSTRAGT